MADMTLYCKYKNLTEFWAYNSSVICYWERLVIDCYFDKDVNEKPVGLVAGVFEPPCDLAGSGLGLGRGLG